MSKYAQIRGMLLEEAILYLLKTSAYRTIEGTDGDETLEMHAAGLAVKGRGGKHQIDAIADFTVTPPFSFPQRLLLEAKCYNKPVGLNVVRNAFGVLRDVEEFWVPSPRTEIAKKRYRYQYAVASISGFTIPAQQYAYAHDIYLLALENASYFQPVSNAINAFVKTESTVPLPLARRWLHRLRISVRKKLSIQNEEQIDWRHETDERIDWSHESNRQLIPLLNRFVLACQRIGSGVMALLNGRFPIMFIPATDFQLKLHEGQLIRVFRGTEKRGWIIQTQTGRNLFSFDIPQEMFKYYTDGEKLTRSEALRLKEENMGTIQLIFTINKRVRIVTLQLDSNWIQALK